MMTVVVRFDVFLSYNLQNDLIYMKYNYAIISFPDMMPAPAIVTCRKERLAARDVFLV